MPPIINSIKSISGHEVASLKNNVSLNLSTIILAHIHAANAIPVGICLIANEKK